MSEYPCETDIEQENIDSGQGCYKQGNTVAYYIDKNEIDFEAMSAAAESYIDDVNDGCQVLDFIYKGTKRFKRLGFDMERSFYDSDRADKNSLWENTFNLYFKGKSPKQTKAINKLEAACSGSVVVMFTENCQARVGGFDWSNRECRFTCIFGALEPGASKDTHGQFGQEAPARDELALTSKSKCRMLWWKDGDVKAFVTAHATEV